MLHEVDPHGFEKARYLLQDLDFNLSINAGLEGNNPVRFFLDDPSTPRTALALTVEGYFLLGVDDNPETNAALRSFFRDRIFSGEVSIDDDSEMELAVYPRSWESRLAELIPTHEVMPLARRHYTCRAVALGWRQHIPKGYEVRRIDHALLDDAHIVFPETLAEWFDIESTWGSMKAYLSKGVGFVALHDSEVAVWCSADCVAGTRIDVGIVTDPSHRRRGLAAVAAAATAEQCLSHGFESVGWHCNVDNVGSWKTAEKVGFELSSEYTYYHYVFDLSGHLAELGWYYYRKGDYVKTVDCYEQVFARQCTSPDYYYHLVASAQAHLGNREQAAVFLRSALDHGWTDLKHTRQQKEFSILYGTSAWNEVLDKSKSLQTE